ncbi:MAG: type II secretion system F family protein [Dehalococcoidia bacterium]|nr:putative type II secretion system protein F [Chloroflexota bacterium]MBT9162711.1 putative type II secretion system protein F [Chloroflexota bacterium]
MYYQYAAYTEDKKLVKGRLSAASEEEAINLLSYGSYQVISLKSVTPFFDKQKLIARSSPRVKSKEIIMFSRQLALLLESGTDIVTSLELLQAQVTNQTLKRIIGEVVYDIRGGSALSAALSKHPQAFPQIYHRTISAGEQGGNLEIVLRQMANFIERGFTAEKKIKSALAYPVIVAIVAVVVVGILVTFVLPTFVGLITAMGGELPLPARILIGISDWFGSYGLFLLLMLAIAGVLGYIYTRTPVGKYQRDKLLLRLPILGRIILLSELSRCCQTMALLFKIGLPLPEIMAMVIRGSNNKAMAEALTEVQQELIKGEGLSRPMSRRKLFLPLMVQMAGVGEETGNLDGTLATVAQSYDMEADDRTSSAVGLIQPALIVIVGLIVGFIALALVTAMFGVYAQMGL